jgi:hypothetical protein
VIADELQRVANEAADRVPPEEEAPGADDDTVAIDPETIDGMPVEEAESVDADPAPPPERDD